MYKQRRKYFYVKYKILYNSGKVFVSQEKVLSITIDGAIDTVKWLKNDSIKKCNAKIEIIGVIDSGEFCGDPIIPSFSVIGDY